MLQNAYFVPGSMQPDEDLGELRGQFEDQGTMCVEVSQCSGRFTSYDSDILSDAEDGAQSVIPEDIVKEKGSTSSARYGQPRSRRLKDAKSSQASIL